MCASTNRRFLQVFAVFQLLAVGGCSNAPTRTASSIETATDGPYPSSVCVGDPVLLRKTFEARIRRSPNADKCNLASTKGYQPIDPIPVEIFKCDPLDGKDTGKCQVLSVADDGPPVISRALPNEAIRLAIGELDESGTIRFGPFGAKTRRGNYEVILDYIKYTSVPLGMRVTDVAFRLLRPPMDTSAESKGEIARLVERRIELLSARSALTIEDSKVKDLNRQVEEIDLKVAVLSKSLDEPRKQQSEYIACAERLREMLIDTPMCERRFDFQEMGNREMSEPQATWQSPYSEIVLFPIYIGVGVRMRASVTVVDASADISSLYQLALSAQGKKVYGTLVIQTLGISGADISPLIPMPSEINVTTIQNAIQALATIKAKLYTSESNAAARGVVLQPQVVSLEDPDGRPGSKGAITATLLRGIAAGEKNVAIKIF